MGNHGILPADKMYPLVNVYITMEHRHLSMGNQLFLWTIFNSFLRYYQRVYLTILDIDIGNLMGQLPTHGSFHSFLIAMLNYQRVYLFWSM